MPSADLTPEDLKVAIYLELSTIRKEYHRVHGALCFMHPSNTITTNRFEAAYFTIRTLLEQYDGRQ